MITSSIVTYNTSDEDLTKLLTCIDSSIIDKVYIIDNSPSDEIRKYSIFSKKVEYFYGHGNIGYGAAHNIAIREVEKKSKYHIVINPDISFQPDQIKIMFDYMEQNVNVGQLMPKILYNDGQLQMLCKLLPTPFDLIGRRFFKNADWAKKRNKKYELASFKYDKIVNIPSLSGCFMFFRNSDLQRVNGFDERFFMYLEDIDLTRRVHQISKTVFYPEAIVFHGFKKESFSNPTLLKYHIKSAIQYFNKWGWYYDKEREIENKKVLLDLEI